MTELTSEKITASCEAYVSLVGDDDVDALMALFAEECTVEDPVGTPVKTGPAEVRAFYETLPPMNVSATLTGPICAVADGRAAAFPMSIETGEFSMNVIDVMTFDDAGRITSMTAYWGM